MRYLISLFLVAAAAARLGAQAVNPSVVISQVYGGGGNSGAPFTHDFIEIFNRSGSPVSLAGWSLQYASATGTGNFGANSSLITELPAVTLQPGQYYLVQQAGGVTGSPLPTPDLVDATPIALSATAGKVVLASVAVTLGCNGGSSPCPPSALAQIIDLVGYGNANFFEGAAAAPTLSNTTAAVRALGGCTDTNVNSADFTAVAPTPRNTASPRTVCGGPTPISGVGGASPSSVSAGGTTLLTVTVTPGTNPASTGITVQSDLSSIGGSATQAFFDNGTHGDVTANDNIFSFNATVNVATTPGAKSLPFNISDAQARTATGSISLTVTAPVILTRISAVQGPGITSPLTGQAVTVRGIVTGVRGNGFYLQSKPSDEDGNPATSEGILVFTGSGNVPAFAVVGNELEVTGTVVEFVASSFPSYTAPPGSATLTELVAPLSYSLVSTGNTLPAPVVIDSSVLSATAGTAATRWQQLERFEGMRVALSNFRVTQTANATTIFGTLGDAAVAYRETGVAATKLPTGTPGTVPIYDANPEVLRIEGNGLSGGNAAFDLPFGSTISSITGVLDYSTSDGIYSIRTNAAGIAGVSPATLSVTPVPTPMPTDFTVATLNAENFSSANATKMSKLSLAIRNVLRMPDVIGFQEINTLASLQALAGRIDQDAAASGQTPPAYTAALLPGNAGGTIGGNTTQNVGFLYKASRFAAGAASQFGTEDNTFTNPFNGNAELTFDRPPLVLTGTARLPTSDSGLPFTIVVNHLRSLIDLDNATNDPSAGGLRVQTKRHFQARDTAGLLQQLNTPGTHLVSVGDYNAFQFSDGYVDIVNCLRGTPPLANALIYQPPPGQACESLPLSSQLVNVTDGDPLNRYSYYFLGSRQTLDHILVNAAANARLRTALAVPLNADFPRGGSIANNATRPEGLSDHNPQIAYFTLPNEVTSKVRVLASGLIYNRALAAFTGTVTVTNSSALTLDGPLHVFFQGLPAGVTLTNANGTVAGTPYITINATLAPGQSAWPAAVQFATSPTTRVTYSTKTYSMAF